MIAEDEILELGYIKEEDLSSDEHNIYSMLITREDKPQGTYEIYRLTWEIANDEFLLTSRLQRGGDKFRTYNYYGPVEDKSFLQDITELFKSKNAKI